MTTEKILADLSSASRQIADLQKDVSQLKRKVAFLKAIRHPIKHHSPYTPRTLPRHKDWI